MDALLEKLEPAALQLRCTSFLDYYYLLKENNHGQWDAAWEALSVQETYFWREPLQIEALCRAIAPGWIKKLSVPLRIWSAACATGEEPYSIAIALEEAGLGSHPVQIIASDASADAIRKAQAALYRERSFRSCPEHLRAKYFTQAPGGWKLSDHIARRVNFRRANLFESADVAALANAHVIFCRNVFIYFSRHSIRQTVAHIALQMPPGGCLCVGASESLLRMTTDFELREIAGALVYMRI